MTDNEVYLLLRVPNIQDRETQILAMVLDLLEHGPTGVPFKLEAKDDSNSKLIANGGSAMDPFQRKRIAKYLYERFGRGR